MATTVEEMVKAGKITPNPLTNLEQTTRDHWREARPLMFKQLEESGKLDAAIAAAAALTRDAVLLDVSRGMRLTDAWEVHMTAWIILPTESDQASLGFEPAELKYEDEFVDPLEAEEEEAESDDVDDEVRQGGEAQ